MHGAFPFGWERRAHQSAKRPRNLTLNGMHASKVDIIALTSLSRGGRYVAVRTHAPTDQRGIIHMRTSVAQGGNPRGAMAPCAQRSRETPLHSTTRSSPPDTEFCVDCHALNLSELHTLTSHHTHCRVRIGTKPRAQSWQSSAVCYKLTVAFQSPGRCLNRKTL